MTRSEIRIAAAKRRGGVGAWWHYDKKKKGPICKRVRDEPTGWRRMM